MSKVYTGDTGTVIVLDCGQDISAASVRSIEVRKPDGTTTSWAAVASGANAISYTTLVGSLDQAGMWKVQAKVTLTSGVWRGATADMAVYAAFG